jgi:hypothetical protein
MFATENVDKADTLRELMNTCPDMTIREACQILGIEDKPIKMVREGQVSSGIRREQPIVGKSYQCT